jgi:hypothetical protein
LAGVEDGVQFPSLEPTLITRVLAPVALNAMRLTLIPSVVAALALRIQVTPLPTLVLLQAVTGMGLTVKLTLLSVAVVPFRVAEIA